MQSDAHNNATAPRAWPVFRRGSPMLAVSLLVSLAAACDGFDGFDELTQWSSEAPPTAQAPPEPEQAKAPEVSPSAPQPISDKTAPQAPQDTRPDAPAVQPKEETSTVTLPSNAKTRRLKRQPSGARSAAPMTVHRASVSTAIEDRKPVGVSRRFDTSVEKLWAYVGIKNPAEKSHVTMVWKHEGRTMSKVKLKVGKSNNWRTWSSKRIKSKSVGQWSVEVVDPDGAILKTMTFQLDSKAG